MTTLAHPPRPASAPDPLPSPDPGSAPGGQPPAPDLEGAWAWLEPYVRPAFIAFNRRLMIPLHRAGFAAWLGSPVGGYLLLLRVRGRRSGVVRDIPLSYLIADGSVWVLAGFGRRTEWYRNLLAEPRVEVRLPGRRYEAIATEAADPAVRAAIMPRLLRATGAPALLTGLNPWAVDDDTILSALHWIPLVRIDPRPGPVEPGADDPGGRAWAWRQAIVLGVTVLVTRGAWRIGRGMLRRVVPGRP